MTKEFTMLSTLGQLKTIEKVGYGFSALAFALFLYSFLFSEELLMRTQGIYWFLIAIGSALVPQIKQLRYKDLEVLLGDMVESRAEPTRDDAAAAEKAVTSPDLEVLEALNHPKWDYRSTTGVLGHVSQFRSVTWAQVKDELKSLKKRGLVSRVSGTDGRLLWGLTSIGRVVLLSSSKSAERDAS